MSSKITELLLRTGGFLLLASALLWPLEHLRPRRRPRLTPRAWLEDLAWLVVGAATLTLVVGPVLKALTVETSRSAGRLALAFLGAEVMAYGIHRALHEVPWLWRFHRVHHGHRELDWLKAWRQHPVDVALHAFAVALPGVLVGAPLSGLAPLVLLRRLWTGLLHANVDLDFGFLEGVIATPRFHHAHHDPRTMHRNYAGLFPWLDTLFGTRAHERRELLPARLHE